MRIPVPVRTLVIGLALPLALGSVIDAQIIKEGRPQQPKLELPSVEEVKRQVAGARGTESAPVPSGDRLQEVVATVDGEPITLDDLLDEVIVKYGAPFAPHLLNQSMFEMILLKRDVEVSEDELIETIRYRLAQSPGEGDLKDRLEANRMGWDRFESAMRQTAAINKVIKSDQKIRDPGPPNPFVMQVWAGKLRGEFKMENAAEKLPPGCFGSVTTTMPVSRVLDLIARDPSAYRIAPSGGDGQSEIVVEPVGRDWPKCYLPAVEVTIMRGGRSTKMPVADVLAKVIAGEADVRSCIAVFKPGEATPSLMLPAGTAQKIEGEKTTEVSLVDAINAIAAGTHTIDVATREVHPNADGPRFRIPKTHLESARPPFRKPLAAELLALAGTKMTAGVFRAVDHGSSVVLVPDAPVNVKSIVDRAAVLDLCFGSLKLAQFEDALASLARYRAIKRAFRGLKPGSKDEPAPWGAITVDEKAVMERIQMERKKYAGTIFPWEMICQILGKTVPEEMRRFWVGNGVDQVIGAPLTEAELKKLSEDERKKYLEQHDKELREYYEKYVDMFGVATVEAWHILIQEKHAKTGRIQWDKALAKANEVLSMIHTGADFGAMAAQYSADPATKEKGGDLGLFTIESRYDMDLCLAAFALEPGQLSETPVKTKHGYHIVKLRSKKGPDRARYGFESEGMKERVRETRQDRLQQAWLNENVFGKFAFESHLEKVLQ